MSRSILEQWLTETDATGKLAAQEELILEVTEAIWEELNRQRWTKSQLAEALGTTPANVTQWLNGSRNMTLRTLADIGRVLGVRVQLQLVPVSQVPRKARPSVAVVELESVGRQSPVNNSPALIL
jgi:transcriptional regulator with XRE-family HTH domain